MREGKADFLGERGTQKMKNVDRGGDKKRMSKRLK